MMLPESHPALPLLRFLIQRPPKAAAITDAVNAAAALDVDIPVVDDAAAERRVDAAVGPGLDGDEPGPVAGIVLDTGIEATAAATVLACDVSGVWAACRGAQPK